MDERQPTDGTERQGVVYVERKGNGLAVASLVLGIIGVVFGFIPLTFFIALICGVVGIGLGIPAVLRARSGGSGGVMAWFGVALSAIAIALGVWGGVIVDDAIDDVDRELERIERELE